MTAANSRRVFVTSADRTRIAVAVTGRGRSLVVVHGSLSTSADWQRVADSLAPQMTTYAIDRRGYGSSEDAVHCSVEQERDDVAAVDDETAEATLAAAWETGVRCFDTAPGYGLGLGEHRFGHFLRRRPRQDFVLATKVGRLVRTHVDPAKHAVHGQGPGASESLIFKDSLPFHIEVDYGYDAAMRSIDDSCQRLGISEIDVVFVHDLGSDHLGDAWEQQFDLAVNGCFRALAELRDQGVIKAWGLGNNVVEPGIRALKEADPDVIQIAGRYTLLDHSALDELFPLCAERAVPVMLGGVYNSDILAGGNHYDYTEAVPEVIAKRDRVQRICVSHGIDIRAAALQFSAAHPVVSTVLSGAKYPEKARQNAEFMSVPVSPELWQELKSEGILPEDAPVPD